MLVRMNILLFFVIFLSAKTVLSTTDHYTDKYDNVKLEDIISSKRLLRNYGNCLLDKGLCSPDGAELKKVLPDVIETDCSKCTERQQNGGKVILKHLIEKEPDIWKLLENKYDPDGTYRIKYQERAKKEGINL